MKKIKIIFACIVVPTSICAQSTLTISCKESKPPKIVSHKIKKCLTYNVQQDVLGRYSYVLSLNEPIEIHFFDNSSIGYISVDDYVKSQMQFSKESLTGHDYTSSTLGNKTTIINNNNKRIAKCVIDYANQTLTYDDFDAFLNIGLDMDNPLATGICGGDGLFLAQNAPTASEYIKPEHDLVINLSKYNIVAYYENGKGYLPYEIFRNLINNDMSSASKYMFNGESFYEMVGGNNSFGLYNLPSSRATIYTPEYMEYRYNLFAITLDYRFGLDQRESRAHPTSIIKYFPNGAFEALAPYHDGLTSLEPNVANYTVRKVMNTLCDDGGHAGYSNNDLLADTPLINGYGDENTYTHDVMNSMEKARNDYWKTQEGHEEAGWEWDDPFGNYNANQKIELLDMDGDEKETKETIWVTFDEFASIIDMDDYTNRENWKIWYDMVDKDTEIGHIPYQYDTILMTMYLQKIINTNHDIQNIFIDLTNNGGGVVFSEHFLASYLCGKNNTCMPQAAGMTKGGLTRALWNQHTGAFGKYTVYADINCDGVYDELDYLPDNINLYIITSPFSFSCANLLPTDIKVCGKATFIGAKTGGGSCYVDPAMHLGLGTTFRNSSIFHSLMSDSTINNKVSNDCGVSPEEKYQIDWQKDIEKFFDRDFIWNLVKK